MTNLNEKRGPRDPRSWIAGARRISEEHRARLRAIVAALGSVHQAFPRLETSPGNLFDALQPAGRVFQPKTVRSLEERIDQLHRELGLGAERGRGAA